MADDLPREETALMDWFTDHPGPPRSPLRHGATVGLSAAEIAQVCCSENLKPLGFRA